MPALRFRGFYDAWEQRKLGDLGSVEMNKRIFKEETSEIGDVPFYKIGTFGSMPNAFISRKLFQEYKDKYSYPEKGDLLISASGSIGKIVEYKGADEYFQDSNIVWLKHDNRLINSFLKQFYKIVKWQGLEGSTIKRLYNKTILETQINIPHRNEQTKIGSFFKQLDNLITQNERKIDLLKQLKQAYLQKIFSQELRFAGFNDDWEERKIVDLFEERSERSPHGQMISITMGSGVVLASSLDRKDNSSFDKSNYKVVRKNDIAYNSMRMWQGASGVSPYNGIVSPAYTIITPKDNVDSGFFAIQFKMAKSLKTFQKYSQGLTSDTWNLKYPALSSIPMITPNFTEQKKINHFFGIFDDLIDKYEKKVLLLKRKKRSYLQKMFV